MLKDLEERRWELSMMDIILLARFMINTFAVQPIIAFCQNPGL